MLYFIGGLYIDPFKEETSRSSSMTKDSALMMAAPAASPPRSAFVDTQVNLGHSSPVIYPTVGGILPM